MNISCVICSDLFCPSSEVYVTQCGHTFHFACLMHWLERSKTCPQCRNKATEKNIHRIYFNLSNSDGSDDAATLQHKVDNLQFKITCKEKDIRTISEKYKKMKNQNAGLREEILESERKERNAETSMHLLKDQVSYLKSKCKEVDRSNEEIIRLRAKLKDMENVHIAINGTREQVNDMLRNEKNIESLALMAATLKKSLMEADRRKRDIEHKYKQLQTDSMQYRRTMNSMECTNADLRKELDSVKNNFQHEKNNWEQEKQYFRNKIADKLSDGLENGCNTSLKRIINESPVPFKKKCSTPSSSKHFLDQTISPSLQEKVMKIKDSESPYLPIKFSNVGIDFNSVLNTKFSKPSTSSNKLSIFNKPHSRIDDAKTHASNRDVAFNGLGGSSKEDLFPSPKPQHTGIKRHKSTSSISSTKFRKLAPSTKVANYFGQESQ